MLGIVRDQQKRPVARIRDTVRLSVDAADELKKKTVQYETGFEMPAGKYHVQLSSSNTHSNNYAITIRAQ